MHKYQLSIIFQLTDTIMPCQRIFQVPSSFFSRCMIQLTIVDELIIIWQIRDTVLNFQKKKVLLCRFSVT